MVQERSDDDARAERLAAGSEIVSTYEIAQYARVHVATVTAWWERYEDFPEPFARTGPNRERRLWIRGDVQAWCVRYGIVERGASWPDEHEADELLTASEVAALMGWKQIGTATHLVKNGTFPRWARVYGRTKLWRRSDVERWATEASRKPRSGQ